MSNLMWVLFILWVMFSYILLTSLIRRLNGNVPPIFRLMVAALAVTTGWGLVDMVSESMAMPAYAKMYTARNRALSKVAPDCYPTILTKMSVTFDSTASSYIETFPKVSTPAYCNKAIASVSVPFSLTQNYN